MDAERFRNMTTAEVAQHVRAAGPKTCVFPINGTRRWFMLEHTSQPQDLVSSYLDISVRRHVELYRLLFDHGVDTLLAPIFGPDLMERGQDYMHMAAEGMARLATSPDFLNLYQTYGVRVRFYGEHRKFFAPTAYAYLSDLFDEVSAKTASHGRHRLFFGVCAQDATETIAELAVQYHTQYGHVPDKRTLVSLYYGEYVPPVDFFIGFDKFCSFDMPLVATGNEDLYFTISPSPYLSKEQLRDILYDHLYTRHVDETDYSDMTPDDWNLMRTFYHANMDRTLGVGTRQRHGGYWYPLPMIQVPDGFAETQSSSEDTAN